MLSGRSIARRPLCAGGAFLVSHCNNLCDCISTTWLWWWWRPALWPEMLVGFEFDGVKPTQLFTSPLAGHQEQVALWNRPTDHGGNNKEKKRDFSFLAISVNNYNWNLAGNEINWNSRRVRVSVQGSCTKTIQFTFDPPVSCEPQKTVFMVG